ncbi:MAG: ABC transporter ATP-binding protein [Dermatophilaceae bacterium]
MGLFRRTADEGQRGPSASTEAAGAPQRSPAAADASGSAGVATSATPVPAAERGVAARTRDLVKVFGRGDTQVVALNRVSLDIYTGEYTAIMGPSGSGKSTLMHCMAGLDHITAGHVQVGGVDLAGLIDKELTMLRRDKVGFVFQAFNLIPTLTARENILLPLTIAGRRPDQQWFDTVIAATGLDDRLSHKPSELSGGQQQRVACARALVSQPDIVFADEPTGNLDSVSSGEVLAFLRRSVDEFGQTVVMVTHDATAASFTDRVIFLADGQVVYELRHPTRLKVLEVLTDLDPRVGAAEGSHAHAVTGPSASAQSQEA